MKNKIITVDRKAPFSLSPKFVEEYGDYDICWSHELAQKINSFTLEDIMFFDGPDKGLIRGKVFANRVMKKGFIPLDAFCAQAIFQREDILEELKDKWWNFSGGVYSNKYLETLNFFGSRFSDGKNHNHLLCLKYPNRHESQSTLPQMIVFENDEAWGMNRDFALVFKKEFIKKVLN